MKKLLTLIISVMLLMSCSEEDESPISKDGSIFLINGLGAVGTLSVIDDDGMISNDVMNVGSIPNHISEYEGVLYIVNSGNNNVQMINASTCENIGSIELPPFRNPMRAVGCNGKIYITSMQGPGLDVYSIEEASLDSIVLTSVPAESMNGGTDAIYSDGNFVFVGVRNINYDNWPIVNYGPEYMVIINPESDLVEITMEVGYNIADILIDLEGDLHVLCSGNRDDVNGVVKVYPNTKVEKAEVEEILLGSEPGSLIMNSEGMVYVGVTVYGGTTGSGGIMKYNSATNEVLNSSENLLYSTTDDVIMDVVVDGYDKLYAPLFYENELIVFENDSIDTVLTTGVGPQGLVFVGEE